MTLIDPNKLPEHVAIIMDGNRRWAEKKGLERLKGHQIGAEAVRVVVRTSRELGIRWLTLYAFSEENWKRSESEVKMLMGLLVRFLKSELLEMQETRIRLACIGRIEKLPKDTRKFLLETIEQTSGNRDMVLTLALSYGGRQELVDAIKSLAERVERQEIKASDVSEELISEQLYTSGMPDPDLLIRTGGEYRVSNFLLWQIAYTEIYITHTLWPDFGKDEFLAAIQDYQNRDRRFGGA
jgi:undecaprenyl diphosphate synthase